MMPLVEILEEITIYENPRPAARSRQATFPGLVVLPNGELLCLFVMGEAFEAANARTYVARSQDLGHSWQLQGLLYDQERLSWDYQFTDTYKPTLLCDGALVAVGYGFERRDPEKGIGDSETGSFPPARNVVVFSHDFGRTWTYPEKIDVGSSLALELSGPAIRLSSGRLLAAGPPFTAGIGQEGWTIRSDDKGRSWTHVSNYFATPTRSVAPWETRLCEMQPGRAVALFWAFDTAKNQHLPNHIAVSHDEGKTWSSPVDTGIQGQASSLMWLGGEKVLSIHSHRKGETGLYVRLINLSGDRWNTEAEQCIWGRALSQDTSQGIIDQFAALKFGQPSLVRLPNGQLLATFWCVEDCLYKIKSLRLKLRG